MVLHMIRTVELRAYEEKAIRTFIEVEQWRCLTYD